MAAFTSPAQGPNSNWAIHFSTGMFPSGSRSVYDQQITGPGAEKDPLCRKFGHHAHVHAAAWTALFFGEPYPWKIRKGGIVATGKFCRTRILLQPQPEFKTL